MVAGGFKFSSGGYKIENFVKKNPRFVDSRFVKTYDVITSLDKIYLTHNGLTIFLLITNNIDSFTSHALNFKKSLSSKHD